MPATCQPVIPCFASATGSHLPASRLRIVRCTRNTPMVPIAKRFAFPLPATPPYPLMVLGFSASVSAGPRRDRPPTVTGGEGSSTTLHGRATRVTPRRGYAGGLPSLALGPGQRLRPSHELRRQISLSMHVPREGAIPRATAEHYRTVMTTLPFLCPVSTYLCASTICSSG